MGDLFGSGVGFGEEGLVGAVGEWELSFGGVAMMAAIVGCHRDVFVTSIATNQ